MRELASRGFWMTNVAPMGYEFEWVEHGGKMRRHLAINPEEQPAIRALWDEAIALNTVLTIARNLNQQGFLTGAGKRWTRVKVQVQQRVRGVPFRAVPGAVDQLHQAGGNHEPMHPHPDRRHVPEAVGVSKVERPVVGPEDADGGPEQLRGAVLAQRFQHLPSPEGA